MFSIGEFSHIARVTTKLLRYYDRLGLLEPVRVDPFTGYRFYSADQLPRLNRILALKEMGFSLDEIGELIEAEVPAEQLRGMLAVKRSEFARQLDRDRLRLRLIESRIEGIENTESLESLELRVKTIEPVRWIAHRFLCHSPEHAFAIGAEIAEVAARVARPARPPNMVAVGHGDFTDVDIDVEIGIALDELPSVSELRLGDGSPLSISTLPRVEAITGVRAGHPQVTSGFYAGLGRWLSANGAKINGPARELIMRPPDPAGGIDPLVEVQFPIRRHSVGAT